MCVCLCVCAFIVAPTCCIDSTHNPQLLITLNVSPKRVCMCVSGSRRLTAQTHGEAEYQRWGNSFWDYPEHT